MILSGEVESISETEMLNFKGNYSYWGGQGSLRSGRNCLNHL